MLHLINFRWWCARLEWMLLSWCLTWRQWEHPAEWWSEPKSSSHVKDLHDGRSHGRHHKPTSVWEDTNSLEGKQRRSRSTRSTTPDTFGYKYFLSLVWKILEVYLICYFVNILFLFYFFSCLCILWLGQFLDSPDAFMILPVTVYEMQLNIIKWDSVTFSETYSVRSRC